MLSIKAAKYFNTKIISADSRQCFKELNIGVAKPSANELQQIEHFFISSHSIHENINAVVFGKYALEKVNNIFKESNVAVMVGGTGLYIKAFCEGLDEMPEIPTTIRDNILQQYKANGLEWLQQQIMQKDLVFWQNAEQQNPHRLLRALELITFTGTSITAFRKNNKQQRNFNIVKVALELPRNILHEKINSRVDAMIQEGLIDEVTKLKNFEKLNALQTVGYKEVFNYLNGETSLQKAVEGIKTHTRQYAKRQITWFKKEEGINWFSANDENGVINFLENYLQTNDSHK